MHRLIISIIPWSGFVVVLWLLGLNLPHQRLHQVGISEQCLERFRIIIGLSFFVAWSLLMTWSLLMALSLLLPLVIVTLILSAVFSLSPIVVTTVVIADASISLGFLLFVLEALSFFVLGKHLLSFVHERVKC